METSTDINLKGGGVPMRTIKNGVADKPGMRYTPNLEVILARDIDVSIHDSEEREAVERASDQKLGNSRVARKGKFY